MLESFEGELKDLRIENEKLKVVKAHPEGSDSNVISILLEEKAIVNKDKLIYELGKEGANTALRFLDEISYLRKQLNSAVCEVADFKVKNSGLRLLVEDKSSKLESSLQGLQMNKN